MKKPLLLAFLLATPAYARTPSSEEREDKQVTVDARPFNFFFGSVSPGLSSGVSAGSFVEPDLIARFTVQGGESCTSSRCSYVERAISFTAQKFVSNSFFLEYGLSIQRNIYHPEDSNAFSGDKRQFHFTYTVENWGGLFGIGNQWQWGHFTLGGRWAAAYQTLFSTGAKIHDDEPDEYQRGEGEREQLKKLKNESKLYVASLILGWSI